MEASSNNQLRLLPSLNSPNPARTLGYSEYKPIFISSVESHWFSVSWQINLLYLGLSLANSQNPRNFISPFPLLFCTRIEILLSNQFYPLNKFLMKCTLRASLTSEFLIPLFQLTYLQSSPTGPQEWVLELYGLDCNPLFSPTAEIWGILSSHPHSLLLLSSFLLYCSTEYYQTLTHHMFYLFNVGCMPSLN